MTVYDKLGKSYDDMINWDTRLDRDVPLICDFIVGNIVLDAACGTGMLSASLSERGYKVTGTDISEEMLAAARNNSSNQFINASLFELDVLGSKKVDSVLIIGNALSYLHTTEDIEKCFSSARRALSDNGGLLLQIRNKPSKEQFVKGNGEKERTDRIVIPLRDDFYDLKFVKVNGDSSEELGIDHLRFWQANDLYDILVKVGFSKIKIMGNLNGVPLEEGNDVVIFATLNSRNSEKEKA